MLTRITIEIKNNEKNNLLQIDDYGKENYERSLVDCVPVGIDGYGSTLFLDFLCGQGWRIDGVEFGWFGLVRWCSICF